METQSVTQREFQRNFYRLKGYQCAVFYGEECVGVWNPNDGQNNKMTVNNDGQSLTDKAKGNMDKFLRDVGQNDSQEVENDSQMSYECEKCGERKGVDMYEMWEDGEERVVCLKCIEGVTPKKMLRGVLRKMRKLC